MIIRSNQIHEFENSSLNDLEIRLCEFVNQRTDGSTHQRKDLSKWVKERIDFYDLHGISKEENLQVLCLLEWVEGTISVNNKVIMDVLNGNFSESEKTEQIYILTKSGNYKRQELKIHD